MARKNAPSAPEEPLPEGHRLVVLVHPATYPADIVYPAKTQLAVPEAIALLWDAAGVAIVIG